MPPPSNVAEASVYPCTAREPGGHRTLPHPEKPFEHGRAQAGRDVRIGRVVLVPVGVELPLFEVQLDLSLEARAIRPV